MKSSLSPVFLLYRYCSWLEHWYKLLLILSVLAAVLGTYFSVQLYKNLRTDLEELLPENAESVKDLRKVLGRVGGLNHLSIVIESQNQDAGRKFAQAVASKMRQLPENLVARVEDSISPVRDFFANNKLLYIDLDDWHTIENYVRLRRGYTVLENSKEKLEADFKKIKEKYFSKAKNLDQFPNGYFESRDGKTHVILAFQPGKVTSLEASQKLSQAARQTIEQLGPKSFAPDMTVGFNGDVQNLVEEHHGLIEDLILSSVIVTLLVGLALLVYFRCWPAVLVLCWSLYVGIALTFGISYWLVGYLNANTAFLGSIVIGNGINFGIIFLARYIEERRNGLDLQSSLPRSVLYTMQATIIAALAAGTAYASLILTDFRGFNQFGIIGGLGMLVCWLTAFTILPAGLVALEKKEWIQLSKVRATHFFAQSVSRFILSTYKPIVLITILSVVFSSIYAKRLLTKSSIETDLSKLRHKNSMLHGAGYWGKKVDAVFGRYLTPTLVMTMNQEDSEKLSLALEEIKKRDEHYSPIADIKRVEEFLPTDQAKKIRIISRIRKMLPPQVISRLNEEDRKLVREVLPTTDPTAIEVNVLPESLLAYFRELNGEIGRMVHTYPRLEASDEGNFWNGDAVVRFTEHVREAIRLAAVPAAIAGQLPLSADMISAITRDGPKATLFAFIAVVTLVLLLFPKWNLARSVLGGLLLGILWLLGIMEAFQLKINFLNFIALPITFGIGVDYAVNIFSRYRLDGSHSIVHVIENTGGAVALCSLTTIIGYGSLLLAGNQALVSFGILAVLGELTCLTAATIALPAIWHFIEEIKAHKEGMAEQY